MMLWRMCAPIWLHFDKISSTIAADCKPQTRCKLIGTNNSIQTCRPIQIVEPELAQSINVKFGNIPGF